MPKDRSRQRKTAGFRSRVAELRRQQILDAASAVFAQKGFQRATIRDVAVEAGIGDGTIYNYFENKTALLIGILHRLNESDRRADDLTQGARADAEDFFERYLRHRFEVLTPHLDIYPIILAEVLVDGELRQMYLEEIVAPTLTAAEHTFAGILKGRNLDVSLAVRCIASTFVGLLVLYGLGDPTLRKKWGALPATMADLLLNGLAPQTKKNAKPRRA